MPTYSIWLEPPPGPQRDALAASIRRAACTGAGGPTFAPHVTLAGGVDLPTDRAASAAAAAVARALPPAGVPIALARSPTVGASYHKSVYLLAEPTPGLVAAAASAWAAAAERRAGPSQAAGGSGRSPAASPPPPQPPHMPHLSILYSEDEATKAAVVAGMAEERRAGGGEGPDGEDDGGAPPPPPAWTRVTAWRTEGPVEGWECVADVGCGGGESG